MIQPNYLKPGSVIGITCPSGYVSAERVVFAVTLFEQWGFKVKPGKTIGTEHNYFSGADEQRLTDLQAMLDNPELDAIMMGRGGYGMSRIIDGLDFTAFLKHPKWICGFSDITLLHSHIQANFGIATLHSPMCGHFKRETANNDDVRSFHNALIGAPLTYTAAPSAHNRAGTAEGILIGGNLSLLVHATGSASEVDYTGKILFIEDIGEHLYGLDRMLMHLKRAGKLAKLKGLMLGGFTDMEDTERPFGQTVEEIIMDKVMEYDYPVCFNFPAGHQPINYTLALGMEYRMEVGINESKVESIK